jgi:hypothetical protein
MPEPKFSEVLDAACRAAGLDVEDDGASDAARRLRNAASHLQNITDRILDLAARVAPGTKASHSYFEAASESAPKPAGKSCDPRAVAAELRITAAMTCSDLNRLRRKFALANHPDRADLALRENATRRMMVANMIIDGEVRRRSARPLATKH